MKERWIKAYTSLLDWEFFFDPLINALLKL